MEVRRPRLRVGLKVDSQGISALSRADQANDGNVASYRGRDGRGTRLSKHALARRRMQISTEVQQTSAADGTSPNRRFNTLVRPTAPLMKAGAAHLFLRGVGQQVALG